MHIPHHDLVRLETALGILYAATSLRSLQLRVMRAAAALVGNQWVSYNEASALGGGDGFSLNTDEAPMKLHKILHALWHEHPTVHPARRVGRAGALTFTDCLERGEVERLPIYNEYYRVLGVKDQLVLFLDPGDRLLRCISISRDRANFAERERALVDLLRPHFDRAARHVSLLEHLTAREAVLVLTGEGVIEFVSDRAGRELRDACGPIGGEGALAPSALRRWLRAQLAAPLLPPVPLHLPVSDGVLVLRLATRAEGRCTIVVQRTRGDVRQEPWRRLTPREREILGWVGAGKSNPEIAAILQMSRRTVEKHMERVLAKLSLESRTQAIRVALEQDMGSETAP